MKNYKGLLIYNKQSYKSAKALATLTNLRPIKYDKSIAQLSKILPIKIRYGNSHLKQDNDTKFNSTSVIQLCSNSLAFSNFCQNNNILSPQYNKLHKSHPTKFPALLRSNYHRAGNDIYIAYNQDDLYENYPENNLNHEYWVEFFPTKYEIRVHYINKNIIRIFLKENLQDEKQEIPIRTARLGWHYSIKPENDEKRFKQAKILVHNIAESIGLGFGAFDLAWSTEHNKYIIWEINTAPGLNPHTSNLYAQHLIKTI